MTKNGCRHNHLIWKAAYKCTFPKYSPRFYQSTLQQVSVSVIIIAVFIHKLTQFLNKLLVLIETCDKQFQCIAASVVRNHWFLFDLNQPLWLHLITPISCIELQICIYPCLPLLSSLSCAQAPWFISPFLQQKLIHASNILVLFPLTLFQSCPLPVEMLGKEWHMSPEFLHKPEGKRNLCAGKLKEERLWGDDL